MSYKCYEYEDGQEAVRAIAWILCTLCGEKHRLLPGVGAPVYWCNNTLLSLKEGDDVEYEEVAVG